MSLVVFRCDLRRKSPVGNRCNTNQALLRVPSMSNFAVTRFVENSVDKTFNGEEKSDQSHAADKRKTKGY